LSRYFEWFTKSDVGAAADPISLTRDLIRRPSVTPDEAGALGVVEDALKVLGFETIRLRFEDPGSAPVENLYARRGGRGRAFCFAGHTDVVPPGDPDAWTHPPFAGALVDGVVWGRGAADMKGAIAAFVAAAARHVAAGGGRDAISLLLTGDEEGPAINGTRKALAWMKAKGERIDHCLVGEPTSGERLGDMMKVGRRGSINCRLTAIGAQGHVAYPERGKNAVHVLNRMIAALIEAPFDEGYERFPPTSLQATDLDVGNPAHNVVPARARARFNARFNPNWTGAAIASEFRRRLDLVAEAEDAAYLLEATVSGEAFLSEDAWFLELVRRAVEARTGLSPEFSTSGGTSDARFIRDVAPVAEFGLVGRTIHQTDEHVAAADILALADVYETLLGAYFAADARP
jgi:succinyl-diaminopimelate desuccinylase